MMERSKVIDYLDLNLRLHGRTQELLAQALESFEEEHDYIEVTPRLRGDTLKINSTDCIALLGYVSVEHLSPFEKRQFEGTIRHALEQCLLRSTHIDHQAHYKWCLTALKTLAWGRYKTEASDDQ